ncbi:hypothetical protein CTAYLR_010670 [Chrysophaeum taylorii]|uniref:Protein kinase domain-containing protein n=1 Tax=Chrysophaeum taylorii TaxID=2483200 RepID=A0AAD7U6M1_9STRA|nr:hypothetical protein CTAYLR_010670 [Chrysophaeum taylorii]
MITLTNRLTREESQRASCALFHLCLVAGSSPRVIDTVACVAVLLACVMAFCASVGTLWFIWRKHAQHQREAWPRTAQEQTPCARRTQRIQSIQADPVSNLALVDALNATVMFAGAVFSIWSPGTSKSYVGGLAFHAILATSGAASAFIMLTALSILDNVVACRAPLSRLPALRRWGEDRSSSSMTIGSQIDGDHSVAELGVGIVCTVDFQRDSDVMVVPSSAWSTESTFKGIVKVWAFASFAFIASYTVQFYFGQTHQILFVFTSLLALIVGVGIVLVYKEVLWRVRVTYPRARFGVMRRAVYAFVVAYAARVGVVTITFFLMLFTPVVDRCDARVLIIHLRVLRASFEVVSAAVGLADSIAFVYIVLALESGNTIGSASTVADAIAPLKVVALDERALDAAPVVGRGAVGHVRLLGAGFVSSRAPPESRHTNFVAIKTFASMDDGLRDSVVDTWLASNLDELRREAFRVAKLSHPYVVQLYGIAESPKHGPCLVSAFCDGGSLLDVLEEPHRRDLFKNANSDGVLARRCARHVAEAMRFLHSQGIIHRDLKPGNVLVDTRFTLAGKPRDRWRFKVTDFGTSRVILDGRYLDRRSVGGGGTSDVGMLTGLVGTPLYMAPEITSGNIAYGTDVDVYSYGILLWDLAAESAGWRTGLARDAVFGFLAQVRDEGLRPTVEDHFDPKLVDLMARCWCRRPSDRPEFRSVVEYWNGIMRSSSVEFARSDPTPSTTSTASDEDGNNNLGRRGSDRADVDIV